MALSRVVMGALALENSPSVFSSDTRFLVEDEEAAIVDGSLFNDRLVLCFKRLLGGGVLTMVDSPSLHIVSISFKSCVNLFFDFLSSIILV